MRISIFGLGYVGAVCAACWAKAGHSVIGVEVNADKAGLINQGMSPIVESELPELIATAVEKQHLRATTNAREAVLNSELSLVCVGTPSQVNGSLDLAYVRHVCEEIGTALREKDAFHVVVMRSTVLPGTARGLVIPTLEEFSGKKLGVGFGVASNPEFLREGTAIYDFYYPPKTVIGETDTRSGDVVAALYEGIDAPLIRIPVETAEMIKYADNAWHATKVVFANEIGNICKELNIDGQAVMEVFCQDHKLNLSSYYLRPGFAFGGSCLPKDVRAICYKARSLDLKSPLLESLLPSNQYQIERALNMIQAHDSKRVGLFGLSFKAGTDDLRESPMVELVERLLGKGYHIKIYDHNVSLASLSGANRDYLMHKIPHISRHLCPDMNAVSHTSDILVIGNGAEEFAAVADSARDDQLVIDLVRVSSQASNGRYQGICW
jgi:GDP-mannose 6-dehydrogenase